MTMNEKIKLAGENNSWECKMAAHKLAFAEYSWIEKYQQIGQCLHQLPEEAKNSRKYWEKN